MNISGKKIKDLRIKYGYTLRDLGEKLNLSYTNISRLENNHFKNPNSDVLYKIADFFEVDYSYFFDDCVDSDLEIKNNLKYIYKNLIIAKRLERKYSRDDLANILGINPNYISAIENDGIPFNDKNTLDKLISTLELSSDIINSFGDVAFDPTYNFFTKNKIINKTFSSYITIDNTNLIKIPVFNNIEPNILNCQVISYKYLNKEELDDGDFFYYKITNDLNHTFCFPESYYLIKVQGSIIDGETVLVLNNGEVMIKKIYIYENYYLLLDEPSSSKPLLIPKDNLFIYGKVYSIEQFLKKNKENSN